MTDSNQGTGLQLRSLVKDGELELSLARVPIPTPDDDEILVRVEATPINPSDLGLLLGPADLSTAEVAGAGDEAASPRRSRRSSCARMAAPREGQSLPVGNEGAGVVVDAGARRRAGADRQDRRHPRRRDVRASTAP